MSTQDTVNYKSVVSDNGSGYIKLGYGGDSFPRFVIPSIVGRPMLRASEQVGDIQLDPIMIGDKAAPLRNFLEINYPLGEGQVRNWEDMELLWDYSFHEKLGLPQDKKDYRILLTEPHGNPKVNRERMAQVMYEKFNFGRVQFEYQATLTLMAEGNRTGVVLDSGDGVSHTIPVYDGKIMGHAMGKLPIAGKHVTQHLIKLLQFRGYSFNSSADFELVKDIKERICYTSIDPVKEDKLARDTTVCNMEYKLPNGQTIIVGRERFSATEILFNPMIIDKEDDNIALMVFNSIRKCDMDLQKELAANIWLSGGTTMIPGLSTRIEKEIKKLYVDKVGRGDEKILSRVPVVVHDPPSRKNAVFGGGSFFGKIAKDENYISREEFEEKGPSIMHQGKQ